MANILIVDDSSFARLTIRKYLEEAGHIVIGEADNGEIGLELYKQLSPDITTMDMLMPVCDGFICLKNILKYDPKAKIVICTEIGQQNVVMRSIQAGAKNFAVKPIHKTTFNNMIKNVLNDKNDQPSSKKTELNEKMIKKQLSFDNILIKNPEDTYSLSLTDDSLKNAGFLQNDILTIDKLIDPIIGDIVLVSVNSKFVIGYYRKDDGKDIIIEPANKEKYKIICGKEYIVGVIIGLVRKMRD
ncbi:MAG: response regulator [Candidatus Gastranaerophilales bacterium]|nr:response regulator [Candidatus Gastranaerophilales bacterium]